MSIHNINALRAFENQFFRNFNLPETTRKEDGYTPSVNTLEAKEAYLLDVDLPGVAKESIKIDVKDNELIISGERVLNSEHTKDDYFKLESQYGSFKRKFSLPEDADAEHITASSENGVLTLSIPKLEEVDNHYSISIK
jgi:HSP20 family protein